MKQQKRHQVLQYVLAIATHQENIQQLQNKLVTHLRFNPRALFRHIAEGNPLTFDSFRKYSQNRLRIKQHQLLSKYFHKHFTNNQVTLQQFSASLLPYTPNVLRELADKLEKQMETRYCDQSVVELYHALLQAQFAAILNVSAQQINFGLSWDDLRKLILKDLKQFGKRLDLADKQEGWELNAVQLRNWMELWTQVHQYKILNLVRWFGGHQERDMRRVYSHITSELHCICEQGHSHSQHSLFREGSVSNHKSPSSKFSQVKKEQNKLSKVRSAQRLVDKDPRHYFKLFIRYVQTIIKTQKRLGILRQGLRPYRQQTEAILHEITSKKSATTRLGPLIQQLRVVLKLEEDVFQMLIRQLQNTKINNNVIYSLFACRQTNSRCTILKQNLLTEIFEVLYTFCLSKATLKSLSRDLQGGAQTLFVELDQHSRTYLDITDLRLILTSSKVSFKQKDLVFLMSHLGDGQVITLQSLRDVLRWQRCN